MEGFALSQLKSLMGKQAEVTIEQVSGTAESVFALVGVCTR